MTAKLTKRLWLESVVLIVIGSVVFGFVHHTVKAQTYPSTWYSWTDCSWNRNAVSNIRVSQSSVYPFPADGTAPDNGAVQSFRRRIDDSVSKWSGVYSKASVPKQLTKAADGTKTEITLQYKDTAYYGALGTTEYMRYTDATFGGVEGDRCEVHGDSKHIIARSLIKIQPLNEWFTQDDAYRAGWESCGFDYSRSYTCTKAYDFGAVMAHELGHALGLHHTDITRSDMGCPTQGNPRGTATQPTMCAIAPEPHRTETRTLENWDTQTLYKHVDLNRPTSSGGTTKTLTQTLTNTLNQLLQ